MQTPVRRATIAMLAALLAYLATLSFPSSEAVRLRNALLIEPAQLSAFDWPPERVPPDFKRDQGAPGATFVRVAQALLLAQEPSEWRRALMIARHVREPMAGLGPVFGDLETTYQQILQGRGYCADATDVFLALSRAAGLSARQWGFSVDRFGGKGHAINEVYDNGLRQWVYLDVFYNYYLTDPRTDRPLSALEVRAALRKETFDAKIVPITTKRPVDFNLGRQLEWFRRGADHWFLWWGNNVESLDRQSSLGRAADVLPPVLARAAEQFHGVALGAYPSMRVLESAQNRADIEAMLLLKKKLLAIVVVGAALTALLLAQIVAGLRRRARARRSQLRRLDEAATKVG
jgi:hypothetical protein